MTVLDQTPDQSPDQRLGYRIVDCDTHIYESRDAFTRYLPKEYHDRAVMPVRNAKGEDVILVGSRVATFNSEQGLGFELAYRPGSLKEMLRQMSSGDPEESYQPEPMRPEYLEAGARLQAMDEQGVQGCVLFPAGMALSVEHYMIDTDALYANVRAFNRWFAEQWGFARDNRLFGVALLSLRDRDRAVAEVDRVLADGAKVVLLPTGPAYGRSPGDPYFDPVWSRLDEAGAVVALHIMPYWYFDHVSPAWGQSSDPGSWHMSAWQWQNVYGERPVQDTLSALIFDNVFGRFPNLRVLSAEHGAEWVPHFVRKLDKSRGMGRNGPWIGGPLSERPSAIFQRHVRVVPYPEDDVAEIVHHLGNVDSIVMGSDWPHAEGLAQPSEFVKLLDDLPAADQRRIMRDNAAELLGIA
jgi:predicted TIM-barrel fold metal-dependent hydrolase